MDKCREQFEAWFNREKLSGITNESMVMVIKEYMYEGWQASRQALVVELPPQHEVAYRAYDSVEIRYTLKDAGIKWTE